MADDTQKRTGQDRARINLRQRHEVTYWTAKFGVSAADLRTAVAAVGNEAAAVEKHFRDASTVASKVGPVARKAPRKVAVPVKPARVPDAIALLRADHRKVSDLFDQFETLRSVAKKKSVVAQICLELGVHAQIEEEIFYPAVKAALKDKELVPEATIEHASVKKLIAQVRNAEPDEMYDARVKVMSEYVRHHVKEEQNEMFPKAKSTRLDMAELGARLQARKEELLAEGGAPVPMTERIGALVTSAKEKIGELTSS